MVTRFRSSGPEGKPHSTKEGRSAEAQRAYMRKHGPQEPRSTRIETTERPIRKTYIKKREKPKSWIKKKLTGVGAGTQGGFGAAKKPKKFQHGGRTNLLEELGRVEGERSNRNRRAEVSRIHGELNKGYATGGPVSVKKKRVGPETWTETHKYKKPYGRAKTVTDSRKKPYHDKTTLAKSERHPHSRLKTQKEYRAITDSAAYKKADYRTQNKMLAEHPKYNRGGRIRKGNGGSAAQQHYLQHGYGPTKAKLRSGKPKIAKKGWA